MFTKALIFFLLGTTLVLANPISQDIVERELSWRDTLKDWINKAQSAVKNIFNLGKETFEDFLTGIKEQGDTYFKIGREKLAELQEKYYNLKKEAEVAIAELKEKWEAKIEEAKNKGKTAFGEGKKKFDELKAQAEAAIKKETAKWESKFDELKAYAEKAIKIAREQSFAKVLNELKENGKKYAEAAKEKFNVLREKYNDLREKAKVAIAERKKALEASLEEYKHKGVAAFEEGKKKIDELKAKIKEEKAKWAAKLDEWKIDAEHAIAAAKEKYQEQQ